MEHVHRYVFASQLCNGKDVVDMACGEGYGAAMIAEMAKTVIGVDASEEAVSHASGKYKKSNLSFAVGDVRKVDLSDSCCDVVVSFETIEHIEEHEKMLQEIKRVLRPNGMLVISSPNRPEYNKENSSNDFHVKELDFDELDALLSQHFGCKRYYGQKVQMGSLVQPMDGGRASSNTWFDDGETVRKKHGNVSPPEYFIAICGDNKKSTPILDVSTLYPETDDLVAHYVGFAKWAQELEEVADGRAKKIVELQSAYEKELSAKDRLLQNLEAKFEVQNGLITRISNASSSLDNDVRGLKCEVTNLSREVLELKETVGGLKKNLEAQATAQQEMNNNTQQKIHELLMVTARMDAAIANQRKTFFQYLKIVGRYALKAPIVFSRLLYNLWPLSEKTKLLHRAWMQKNCPGLLLASGCSEDSVFVNKGVPVNEGQGQFDDLAGRKNWRGVLGQVLLRFAGLMKKPLFAVLKWVREYYNNSSLSYSTKVAHRRWLAKYYPGLLAASGAVMEADQVVSVKEDRSGVVDVVPSHEELIDMAETIDFVGVASDAPVVSIIIPAYECAHYTLRCIKSIREHAPETPFEVILIDDCSSIETYDLLKRMNGVRIYRNEENSGFIRSTNRGASYARGDYVYFLNNDTEVAEGWLDALYQTFIDFPGTGLAGSKLVYPDGRLQEAGGIIWKDGSAWNYGRLQDPSLPEFNYAREVDYVSGASIMVPTELFMECGSFDEHYLPAYCEDSDLAVKIRDKGYRVIYQPVSTVIHYEGVSHGNDIEQGMKAYQVVNTKKLFARWQHRFQHHQEPGQNVHLAKHRGMTKNVLVLDHCTPTPDQDAGSITLFNTLLLLRDMGFHVTFIPEDNFWYMPKYTKRLQENGIEVVYGPYTTTMEAHAREFGELYDLVFMFRVGVVERHLTLLRKYCVNAKFLYHTVDLHFLRVMREAELESSDKKRRDALEIQEAELEAMMGVDASIVHSTEEAKMLAEMIPDAKIFVFPLIMDIPGSGTDFESRDGIVFVGGYAHPPNVDAVKYFAKEIMPGLRKRLPGVKFYAVGSNPPDAFQELASNDVVVTGFVEDLGALLDGVRLSVAPLRYGAGIKGKIGTAMAKGLPVVATTIAAEGMGLTNRKDIILADGQRDMLEALVELYTDEEVWESISVNGLETAEKLWGAEAAWGHLENILSSLGFEIKPRCHSLSLYRA